MKDQMRMLMKTRPHKIMILNMLISK